MFQLPKISERIYQAKVILLLINGFQDSNSLFCKNKTIQDIILAIVNKSNDVIENEFTKDALASQKANVWEIVSP
ncbi:MAG: hypothetical protein H0W50_02185 [Parachlamydiaceae bacterium]|nr:hypothetical protein [Parachlamydiaceae bacterium]